MSDVTIILLCALATLLFILVVCIMIYLSDYGIAGMIRGIREARKEWARLMDDIRRDKEKKKENKK